MEKSLSSSSTLGIHLLTCETVFAVLYITWWIMDRDGGSWIEDGGCGLWLLTKIDCLETICLQLYYKKPTVIATVIVAVEYHTQVPCSLGGGYHRVVNGDSEDMGGRAFPGKKSTLVWSRLIFRCVDIHWEMSVRPAEICAATCVSAWGEKRIIWGVISVAVVGKAMWVNNRAERVGVQRKEQGTRDITLRSPSSERTCSVARGIYLTSVRPGEILHMLLPLRFLHFLLCRNLSSFWVFFMGRW